MAGVSSINIFTADFSGSMQHYHKVITIKNPDSELELTMPCGKFAIKLNQLYVIIY